jgi:mannose-6-phosphate isomerase-like protein (cupin superfamily)
MPESISGPSYVDKSGGRPKFCDTYAFPVRPKESHVQVHHMRCAAGWAEPEEPTASGIDKYILVLRGLLRVGYDGGVLDVRAGEAFVIRAGERVWSSAPGPAGAEYIVVCLLGFPREADHRGRESSVGGDD